MSLRALATSATVGIALFVAPALALGAGFPIDELRGGVPTLAPILEKVTPGVVNIATSETVRMRQPLLRDPFGQFAPYGFSGPRAFERQAAGSGVIVDAAKGYVLTNHHVVDGADTITVTLSDRRQFDARLVGTDPETDIAVLKIAEPKDLVQVRMGDSNKLKVGDFVVAVGNPFGLGQSVTSGIVSALGRGGLNIEGYEDFIQTDASINPGNSGGALLDLQGNLIGINTAIIGPAGGNVGIGFAVPIAMAKSVMAQILEHGEVRRGRLGVEIADLSAPLAKELGLKQAAGVVIMGVQEGSNAEKAGLRRGDVVLGVNGSNVSSVRELRNRIGLLTPGEKVEVAYSRGGRNQVASIELAPADTPTQRALRLPG